MSEDDDEYGPTVWDRMWDANIGGSDPFSTRAGLFDRIVLVRIAIAKGVAAEIIEELLDSTASFDWSYWARNIEEGERSDRKHNTRLKAVKAAVAGLVAAMCERCGKSFMRKRTERYCSFQCRAEGRRLNSRV